MAAAVALSLRERDPVAGTGRLFGRLLLCSATVYPWYLLWVLPWAALRRDAAWLALSGLILLSYLPQFAGVALWPWVYLGIWGPFAILLLSSGAISSTLATADGRWLALSAFFLILLSYLPLSARSRVRVDGRRRGPVAIVTFPRGSVMPTYRLTLAYRGTAYAGWQRQENALAVQQVVEEALERLLGRPARIVGASRTDAGVHARGQAAHLELAEPFPERGLVHGTNRHLPGGRAGARRRRHAAGVPRPQARRGQGVPLPAGPRRRPLAARLPLRGAGAGRDRPRTDGQSGGPAARTARLLRLRPRRGLARAAVPAYLLRPLGGAAGGGTASWPSGWSARGSCAAWFVLWWER